MPLIALKDNKSKGFDKLRLEEVRVVFCRVTLCAVGASRAVRRGI